MRPQRTAARLPVLSTTAVKIAMTETSQKDIARAALARHPRSPADELRIDVGRNTPAPLYQWLIASLLFSARISADTAQKTMRAVLDQGWRTPARMAETGWEERVAVLNRAGYARYDESTSRYVGATTDLLIERYGGDLRRLRDSAAGDTQRLRDLVKQFKGIGDVGADIFFREVQTAWDELYPFADRRALAAAEKLGLQGGAAALARLAGERRELPRLLAALVRLDLAHQTV